MSALPVKRAPEKWLVIAAFAAVYIIWGSTYLAIAYAIESIPPFLMAGLRFITAGFVMLIWARQSGAAMPKRIHWRSAAILGFLLLTVGNGGVTWAEVRVPTGLAALMVSIVPIWVVLLNWVRPGGVRPSAPTIIGVVVGFIGIVLLVSSGDAATGGTIDPAGLLSLLAATFCWSTGTLYSSKAQLPESPILATGMEMLCGGAMLTLVGTVSGEWAHFNIAAITPTSLLAVAYLVVFGAVIAFTAYTWLLRVVPPAQAATYAYVNPVVALILGAIFRGEILTPQRLAAGAVIVAAVVIITTYRDGNTQRSLIPERIRGLLGRET